MVHLLSLRFKKEKTIKDFELFVNNVILFGVSSPFVQAYTQSDFLGKCIFLSLILTSIVCWTLLIYKVWLTRKAKSCSRIFRTKVQKQKGNLLILENQEKGELNPFYVLFSVLKKQTIDLLNKNHQFAGKEGEVSYLSPTDIDYIEAHLVSSIANQTREIEKYLFILSTIVGLAPLMGLLGTVWGILHSFSQMQAQALSSSNQMVLGGISLALTTTVLGILIAIPALIGYNYLKNSIRHFETDMEGFSNEMLSSIEMRYRKVDVAS